LKTFALIFLFPLLSWASLQVAFLEIHDTQGKVVQFEPNGRFGHLAISYQGQWLHAHPYYGVQLVSESELQKIGSIAVILTLAGRSELDPATVQPLLGKPFDHEYNWSEERYYCSELVGKLLSLPPEPMDFSAAVWPSEFKKHQGEPGLSPDGIFRQLSHPNP
jgi:hypothetical protein